MATKRATALAFAAGKAAHCHNARTDGTTYRLHNTDIARKIPGGVELNWGGWYKPTTASHMNEVLRAVGANTRVDFAMARDLGETTVQVPT